MKYDRENDKRIRLRTEMTDLLIRVNREAVEQNTSPNFPEQAQTYGVIVVLISSRLVVWFGGKSDSEMSVIFGLQGVFLGSFVILASQFSLATKLNRFANWLQNLFRDLKVFRRLKDYK